jgi:hypothetical protein
MLSSFLEERFDKGEDFPSYPQGTQKTRAKPARCFSNKWERVRPNPGETPEIRIAGRFTYVRIAFMSA